MKALLALAALLTAAPTTPVETGLGTPYYAGNPPIRYNREGAALILFVADVAPFCGIAPEGLTVIACTRSTKEGVPVIIMPHPAIYGVAGDYYARIMAHELAHDLGGWPADHPQ
jgi:hypothetical protein